MTPPRAPQVPGYRLGEPVGFGAAGAVWAARDPAGRAVVLAVLPLAAGERGAAQLRRLAALRAGAHPHLPRVLDVVALGEGRCAVASEVVDGPVLTTVRAARGALVPGEAATLLGALGAALGHLHERGVVHGDVAPSNVILAPGGVPVLVDLAGEVGYEKGTAGFVAPERLAGAAATAAGDVWSLARTVAWACDDDPAVLALLEPALADDPAERPSARDLAARVPALGARAVVRLPEGADLAGAQLRARAGHAPTAPATARRRGRHGRRGPSWTVLPVAVGLAAGLLGAAAWTGAGVPLGDADAAEVVRGLVERRDGALVSDRDRLGELTVPGSAAAAADRALLAALDGVRLRGLRTTVTGVTVVEAGTHEAVVEVRSRQGAYTRVDGDGEALVAARPPRCSRLTLTGPEPWRVSATEPCPRSRG